MAELHELIAAEKPVIARMNLIVEETKKTFGSPNVFQKMVTELKYFDESEGDRLNATEATQLTTTVEERLAYTMKPIAKFFDLNLQKDVTNQHAKGDITLENGKVLVKDVPVTTLLMLESKLSEFRTGFLNAIPTVPAGVPVVIDPTETGRLFKTEQPTVTYRTKKQSRAVVLYEATKEHPAQIKEINEDVPVAKISKNTWYGMLTSAEKSDILGRIDSLLIACKKARMRANKEPIKNVMMGADICSYILGNNVLEE